MAWIYLTLDQAIEIHAKTIDVITVGQCFADLEFIAKASEPEEWADSAVNLPI